MNTTQHAPLPPQIGPKVVAAVLAHLGSISHAGASSQAAVVTPDPGPMVVPAIQPNLEVVAMLDQISTRLDNIEKGTGNRQCTEMTNNDEGQDGDDEQDTRVSGQQRKKQKRIKVPKCLISGKVSCLNTVQKAIRVELQVSLQVLYGVGFVSLQAVKISTWLQRS